MKAFTAQRKIAASSEYIFKAIEDSTLLGKWWGPAGFTITSNTFEFKPGGKWSFVMHGPDGKDYPNVTIFREISRPRKVAIRHDSNPQFTVTVSIEDVEDGSTVSWHQEFDSEDVAKNIAHIAKPANEQILDKLKTLIESTGSPSNRKD
jgi:uncharacterized protein YndB with AHSA1/START domain